MMENDRSEDLAVDSRIILKWVFKNLDVAQDSDGWLVL